MTDFKFTDLDIEACALRPYQSEFIARITQRDTKIGEGKMITMTTPGSELTGLALSASKACDAMRNFHGSLTINEWNPTVYDWLFATGKKKHYLAREMRRQESGICDGS